MDEFSTERKRIETTLSNSEESFRLLVEGVKDYAIFILDLNGRVVTWNPGAQRIKGYQADQIIGQHFSKFYTQEDVENGKPDRELKIAASEGRLEDEGWRVRQDGSRFWANVIITAIKDKNGELLGFSKVTRDFTDRKTAEQALQQSEQRFRTLFESSPDAIIAIDQNGKITEANSQVGRFFGYSRADLLGQPVEILIPERFRNAPHGSPKRILRPTADSADGDRLGASGRRKDGSEFPVDIMLSPVETAAGRRAKRDPRSFGESSHRRKN